VTGSLDTIVDRLGYVGIFLMLVVSRSIPPVPTEAVLPLAGLAAADGRLSLAGVALAGGLGSAVGELLWYLPSRWLGRERLLGFLSRHGHWFTLRQEQIDFASDWFTRHGALAVVASQPIPGLRTVIAIPAGALGQSLPRFLLCTALGSTVCVLVVAAAGYALESAWPEIARYLGWLSLGGFGLMLLLYLVRLARFRGG
jgi:membrane protein DedA with SNARE-associated domain